CSLLFGGCNMEQANGLIAGLALAILGQLGQQSLISGSRAKGERVIRGRFTKSGAGSNDPGTRGGKLARMSPIKQGDLRPGSCQFIGGAGPDDPAAYNNDIIHEKAPLISLPVVYKVFDEGGNQYLRIVRVWCELSIREASI